MKAEVEAMVLVVSALVLMSVGVSAQAARPNFILIMTDDQGFDDYGFRQAPLETPAMDKMMKQGVQFTRYYTGAACGQTRSQLMTGRNFMKTGTASVGFGGDAPHLDEYMLGQAMQDAGYVTGMVGKWNLGESDAELPHRRGFDETWEVAGGDVRNRGRYHHYDPPFYHNGTYTGVENGWQVELVTDKAIDFIKRHKKDPFFLYLPYSQPHGPWHCRESLQKKYIEMGMSEAYAMFLGMMEQLDIQVGRILKKLEKNGLSDDTIVLFFGDNGPTPNARVYSQQEDGSYYTTGDGNELNETEWAMRNPSGLRSKKATGWENGVRNRLSVFCPAKFESKEVRDMTLVMDIYPTLLDLAGAQRKADAPPLDGISLRPLLSKRNADWPEKRTYFTATTGTPRSYLAEDGWYYRFTKNHSLPFDQRSSCFIRKHWVVVNDQGEWGLFNLLKDPQQKNDLKEVKPRKFEQLQREYYGALRRVRSDPHAWSEPVQVIGFPDVDDPYLEMSYTFRMKGMNQVTWENTFFKEIGATQQLRLRVLRPATYKISVLARKVPPGTRVKLRVGTSKVAATLEIDQRMHELGQIAFEKGEQIMSLKVDQCDDLDALPHMQVYNLRLEKV